jgi:hypothetical protein
LTVQGVTTPNVAGNQRRGPKRCAPRVQNLRNAFLLLRMEGVCENPTRPHEASSKVVKTGWPGAGVIRVASINYF